MHGDRRGDEAAARVRVAGFWVRSAAALVDLALLAPVLFACGFTLRVALPGPLDTDGEWAPWLLELLIERHWMVLAAAGFAAAVCLAYEGIFVALCGQTIGQQLFGLRVIDEQGGPPGPVAVLLRVCALPVGLFFLGLGSFWIAFDREARGFHDHVSGTLVVFRAPAAATGFPPSEAPAARRA